jgi:hypothetical protein
VCCRWGDREGGARRDGACRSAIASIVIVIDYKAGGREAWDNLRLTLQALTEQDYREPVGFLLVEADDGKRVPDDLQQIVPGLRVVRSAGKTSYDFKNAGAQAAASDFVVLLDADCVPQPGWRALIEHRRQHPEAAAISGPTLYRAAGLLPRILALIDRSYVDCGGPGRAPLSRAAASAVRRVASARSCPTPRSSSSTSRGRNSRSCRPQIDELPAARVWIVEIHPGSGRNPASVIDAFRMRPFDLWWGHPVMGRIEPYAGEPWTTRTTLVAIRRN